MLGKTLLAADVLLEDNHTRTTSSKRVPVNVPGTELMGLLIDVAGAESTVDVAGAESTVDVVGAESTGLSMEPFLDDVRDPGFGCRAVHLAR